MHGLTEILEAEVEIPIDNVPSVVVPLLEFSSVPLVSKLLDVELMHRQIRAENVFNLVALLELEAFEIEQWLDRRLPFLMLRY